MIDVDEQTNAARRTVGGRTLEAGEARIVTVGRTYATGLGDLWDACTNPERIPRWFLPVSGDLREGGRYQLEGNAGGTIEHCEPPNAFRATWEYGGQMSWIELRLTAEHPERTRFELDHIAQVEDELWTQFGPGAVGIGWDLGLLGLGLHLASGEQVDPKEFETWTASEDGVRFVTLASEGWRKASVAAGTPAEEAKAAADRSTAFYTGAEA